MSEIVKIGQKELDLSLPYSDEEMRKAYDLFILDAENKKIKDDLEKKLSQTAKNFFFSDPITLCIRIIEHMGIDVGDFDHLPNSEQLKVFGRGGPALLASIFQKKHEISEIVSWALAVTAVRNFRK